MRRRSHNHLILLSVLFWALAAAGLFAFATSDGAAAKRPEAGIGQLVARQCIDNAFPVMSRGGVDRQQSNEVPDSNAGVETGLSEASAGGVADYLKGMVEGSLPFLSARAVENEDGQTRDGAAAGSEEQLGGAGGGEGDGDGDGPLTAEAGKGLTLAAVTVPEPPKTVPVLDTEASKKPLVLIFHTHATESYQPVSIGNFHSVPEEGTVRQVGNELTKALEAKGISVIHDKTLHDNPSYNQSYGRSLATVQNYLKKYPSIKIVIDLHRDAASYSGNVGKTTTIAGNKVATYSLVIGKGNANVDKLHQFANRINAEADRLYPGLAGRIIDKEYRFNQYVCDQNLLLEVGNNENTIDQVKLTGKYFADILEAYIKKYPQN